MFRVNNKDTRTMSMAYFTPFSSIFIVDFEQVNISWVGTPQFISATKFTFSK